MKQLGAEDERFVIFKLALKKCHSVEEVTPNPRPLTLTLTPNPNPNPSLNPNPNPDPNPNPAPNQAADLNDQLMLIIESQPRGDVPRSAKMENGLRRPTRDGTLFGAAVRCMLDPASKPQP